MRITLERDQQHSLVADTSELTHLVVRGAGEHREYLLHVHSLFDGVLEANGISHIAGPCALPCLLLVQGCDYQGRMHWVALAMSRSFTLSDGHECSRQ